MKSRNTLYSSSSTDFRKGLVCIIILVLSVFTNFQTSSAFSFAIFLQAVCNGDSFWDFIDDKQICKPLRTMIKVLIGVSVLGILLALLNLMAPTNFFDNPNLGVYLKALALITVAFPLVVLRKDYKLNAQIEEQEGGI